mmetsp:Transcript_36873/g.79980  ORF Transcript_36873/g.79980 Transcript_36873/m.79980 type:complete len:378 (-) Transcript_36873:196-1329(-)
MSGPSAPTLPIKGRSNVTASAASGARAAASTPGTTGGGVRSPKKSSTNKQQRDGSARHKAWADFTPTPWDYVSTPWGPPAGLGGIPPYESVFSGAAAAGGSSATKKKDGNFPSTPTPKSWGATPTPSGAAPPTNFGLSLGAPPPLLGPTGLPILPPGFAAMQAQMAAAAAAGAAAGAAAAASLSRDASPVDLMTAAALDLFKNYREDEDVAAARRDPYLHDHMLDSSPWGLQPGMPLPVGEGNKKRGARSGGNRGGKGSGPASKAPAPPPPEHHNIPPRRPSPLAPEQPVATIPEKDLPSKGSSIHGSGKCRPCAWFWKADGCHSAQDCNYCHLCPEGELKMRKKLKVAAMRMGALTPAKPGNPPGAARTLKLTSLV